METDAQDMQQGLKHGVPLATTWLGQQTDKIRETLQRNGEPNVNLTHNKGQTRNRHIGQCLKFQRRPVMCAKPSCFAAAPCTGQSTTRDGRSSMLKLRGFGATRMKGLSQSRWLGLAALQNFVPLICPQLHRCIGVKKKNVRHSLPTWQAC